MTDFQTEILEELERIVNEKELTFVVQKEWGNVGVVYIMKEFDCVAKGSFEFHTQYCSLTFGKPTDKLDKFNSFLVGSSRIQYHKDIPKFLNEYKEFVNELESVG